MNGDDRGYPLGRQIGRIEEGIKVLMEQSAENKQDHIAIREDIKAVKAEIGTIKSDVDCLKQWKKDYIAYSNLSPRLKITISGAAVTGIGSLLMFVMSKILGG